MPPVQTCSECGQRLPQGAPEWLCPVCALRSVAEGGGGLVPEVNAEGGLTSAVNPALVIRSPAPRFQDEESSSPLAIRPLPLPRSFGDYELIEEIARGGMGVVYKARQRSLNRVVALKMVLGGPLASEAAHERFLAEAQTAASLQHPNIVAIHEVGEHAGQAFFSMDYVEGRNLAELLRDGPLLPQQAATYAKTIAEAVAYAHQRGVLHRDLKPSNVLVDQSGQPRITDFGLAKRLTGESDLTVSGQVLGSPNFMAPEQAQGRHREAGPPGDVYSMGALLYHLLTGRPPFQAATLTEVLRQVVAIEPAAPRLLNPSLPRDLETICLKCLEKDIARRYPTAQALADELGRFLRGEPILAHPLGWAGKAAKWCRRNPRVALAAGVAFLSLLIGLVGVALEWRQAESQRARAEVEALLARRNAYAADMKEVERALEDSDLGRARELLDRYQPASAALSTLNHQPSTDLRGWEWRYLWSRCHSDEQFTLCRYSHAVCALAFSPDGKSLVVRQEGGTVALWDALAKKLRAEEPANGWGPCAKALAFSPRMNLYAWAIQDAMGKQVVRVADLAHPQETVSFPHPAAIRSLAFSPDAKTIATMADDGAVRTWEVDSHRVVTNLLTAKLDVYERRPLAPGQVQPHFASVTVWSDRYGCVLFSPDGHWLAVGEIGAQIRLLDRTTGEERKPIPVSPPGDGITAMAFSPDSRLLAAGCGVGDNDVHLWDLVAGTEARLKGHSGCVTALAFSPDGQTLASASADQTIQLWDVTRRSERRRFQGNTDEIWALAWSPDSRDLVSGAKDGSVRYWDPAAKAATHYAVVPEHIQSWGLAFLPNGKSMLTLTKPEGAVVRWDTPNMRVGERLSFLGTYHTAMDLSPDGRLLAVGDALGGVQVWDLPARQMITNLAPLGSRVDELLFSAHGNLLACGGVVPGGVHGRLWAVARWREVSLQGIRVEGATLGGTLSPDERVFAAGYYDGTAAWWDLESRRRIASFGGENAGVVWVAFSPDGRLFVTGGLVDGRLTVWDTATQRPRSIGRASRNGLQHLVFSPDSQRLAACGMGTKAVVKLWDPEAGRDVVTLPGELNFINHITFSPDGNTLLAASREGTALLWHAPSFEEIARIENQRVSAKPTESP